MAFAIASRSGNVPAFAQTTNRKPTVESLAAEMNAAIKKVQAIVNQPPMSYNRTPQMEVTMFPGWYHPGATKPDFNTVDVHKTQEFHYDQHPYVASEERPNVVYVGNQLEFNSMTKYFITDRSYPRRRLTEPEMWEINRLYRLIGKYEQQIAELKNPGSATADGEAGFNLVSRIKSRRNYVIAALVLVVVWGIYRTARKPSA